MATTKKPTKPKKPDPTVNVPALAALAGDVFTLAEAAAYLRVTEDAVKRLMVEQDLPGRHTGNDWRFLKSAIQEWLSVPPPQFSKEAQMAVIGSWKDDPYIEEELKEIYKNRGRPMTEDES